MPTSSSYSHANARAGKLADNDRQQIAALYEEGWSTTALAARFGVAPSAVSYHLSKMTVLFRDRTPAQKAELSERRRQLRRSRS